MNIYESYKKVLGVDNIPTFIKNISDTPSLNRLKNIDYFCGMKYASPNLEIYKFSENPTRYDHSLTTALLTWKLTKEVNPTIAALYHDVATPCFSHVIDYMNKDYVNQESTEEYTEKIINEDFKLYQLLNYYEINKNDVSDFKKYSVVDNNRPKLCADRLDGIITTGISWTKNLTDDDVKYIVNDINLYKNEDNELEIGFESEDIARLVYDTSVLINDYTHKEEDTYMMQLLAKITKLLIKKNIITYDDLYVYNELQLINIINKCNDKDILELFNKFQTIKEEDIKLEKEIEIKDMNLNPLVKTKRLLK